MYNSLVERCFRDCVDSFRRKDLDNAEEKVRRTSKSLLCALVFLFVFGRAAYVQLLGLITESSHVILQCVQACCEKFMKHSARVGIRFGELSAAAESQMQAVMQSQANK